MRTRRLSAPWRGKAFLTDRTNDPERRNLQWKKYWHSLFWRPFCFPPLLLLYGAKSDILKRQRNGYEKNVRYIKTIQEVLTWRIYLEKLKLRRMTTNPW
jgi:hypothetical protein